MIDRFMDPFREAVTYRRQAELPRLAWIIASVTVATLAYIILAIIVVPRTGSRDFNFINE